MGHRSHSTSRATRSRRGATLALALALSLALGASGCAVLSGMSFREAVEDADAVLEPVINQDGWTRSAAILDWDPEEDPDALAEDLEEFIAEDRKLLRRIDSAEAIMGPIEDSPAKRTYLQATAKMREAMQEQIALWEYVGERIDLALLVVRATEAMEKGSDAAFECTRSGNKDDWDAAADFAEDEATFFAEAKELLQQAHEVDDSLGFDLLIAISEKDILHAQLNKEMVELGARFKANPYSSSRAEALNDKIEEKDALEGEIADMPLPDANDFYRILDVEEREEAILDLWGAAFELMEEVDDLVSTGAY